ncbi:hypothetical protein ACEZ3G_05575 [Maribacter algicola]|uniref:Uncharacterized protein n=1 Tax=Meishania litoralis TaxID=3434685 RepID=A0ACC7LGU0_9FLAO
MKLKHLIVILLSAGLFSHCSKDENSTSEPDIEGRTQIEEQKLELYFSYFGLGSSESDNWIIIHDENGKLVDFKKADYGKVLEFTALKDSIPNKISITEFHYFEGYEGNLSHRLFTYTDIEPGSSLYKPYNYSIPNNIGTFDLRIENIPGVYSHNISIEGGPINPKEVNIEGNLTSNTLVLSEIRLYENEEYVFSIYDKSGNHKYLLLESPVNESDLVFDYSEFKEFDDYFEIPMPPYSSMWLYSYGYAEDDPNYNFFGQTLSHYQSTDYPDTVRVGYLDKYKKFKTEFNVSLDGFTYNFIKTGNKVENIQVPSKPNYVLRDSSVYDLTFTTDLKLSSKNSTHTYDNGENIHTQWSVYSSANSFHKVGKLPEEVVSKYPNLNLDKLNILTVTLFTQGYTQQEIFDQLTSKEKKGDKTIESYLYIYL